MTVRWIFIFCGKEGVHLNRRYLTAVTPLPGHVLQVDFVSGSGQAADIAPEIGEVCRQNRRGIFYQRNTST